MYAYGVHPAYWFSPLTNPGYYAGFVTRNPIYPKNLTCWDLPAYWARTQPQGPSTTETELEISSASSNEVSVQAKDDVCRNKEVLQRRILRRSDQLRRTLKKRVSADQFIIAQGRNGEALGRTKAATKKRKLAEQ